MERVTFPIRVLAALGMETLIITNAAGAVNEAYRPGQVVAIRDHINLMGDNPLRGTSDFIDLTRAYAPELLEIAGKVAEELDLELPSGVYLAMAGPCYETPAEIVAIRNLGADLVGMSTVPEVIVANTLGLGVLGLSMVTNMAAGITGQPLSHRDVMEISQEGKTRFKHLVKKIVSQI
jgi:purine-nucleoside phosphorylase